MNLTDLATEDLKWLCSSSQGAGEPITYQAQGGDPIDLEAIVNRNASNFPNYGYENTMSERCHEVVLPTATLLIEPKRGDKVLLDGKIYTVFAISPNDDTTWRLFVR